MSTYLSEVDLDGCMILGSNNSVASGAVKKQGNNKCSVYFTGMPATGIFLVILLASSCT